ncbi:hypothetical protein B0H13DRAFT_2426289, partial [Mycena leptocephala]
CCRCNHPDCDWERVARCRRRLRRPGTVDCLAFAPRLWPPSPAPYSSRRFGSLHTRARGAPSSTDLHRSLLTPAPSPSVTVCACVACAARPACASLSQAASNPASSRPRASSRVAATCGVCLFKSHVCIYIRRRLHVQRLRACLRFASPLLGWDVRRATPDAQRPCAY